MTVGMDAPGEAEPKVHSTVNLGKPEPPVASVIILPAGHKHELHHSLINNTAEHETNPQFVGYDGYCRPAAMQARYWSDDRPASFVYFSFVLFICMPRVARATLEGAACERREGERSLRFFRPLIRCASSTQLNKYM